MYRKDGLIPVLQRDKFPARFVVFDTEANRGLSGLNGEYQTFRMAVLRYIEMDKALNITLDETFYFQDTQALYYAIEQYTRKDKTLYLYAHNIKYDLQLSGLLLAFLKADWKIKAFVFEDPPTFIRLIRNRSSVMMLDTFNYWQTSLEKMGLQLGLVKLPMPEISASFDDWKVYCKRDVDVLTEYLLTFMRFLHTNDLCGVGLTLASQALRSFRHKFMTCGIFLHNRPEVTSLEREGYSGGRVEAYHIGQLPQKTYYKLDVNSMYPYVMRDKPYPVELIAYSENVPLSRLIDLMKSYYCLAEVRLNTSNPAYPLKHNHKLIFPTGDFITTLHQSELEYALSCNDIVEVRKLSIYRQAPVFKDYIDFFYDLKVKSELEGNQIVRHQSKILMNSLYGKFGQQNVISRVVPNPDKDHFGRVTGYSESLHARVEVNYLGKEMEVSYKQGESMYSFPAIAGAVTAYARIYLWSLLLTAGKENVFYLDTDSLTVNESGLINLQAYLDKTRLGYLKLEDQAESVFIWGAKDYQFGEEIKHKGIPHSASEILPGVWQYDQFQGAKEWISGGLNSGVTVHSRIKERKSTYDKGEILQDGQVIPLSLRGLVDG